MAEVLSPFGREWIMFGQGPGLKTQGLLDFQQQVLDQGKYYQEKAMVLPGVSLGASIYRGIVALNRGLHDPYDCRFSEDFTSITREIVTMLPVGRPVAIRSSATNEREGGGNKTFFYARRNDDLSGGDLSAFQDCITQIYTDYYLKYLRESYGPKSYQRLNQVIQDAADNKGYEMGILIQPVVGMFTGDDRALFAPVISGLFTVVDGEPYRKVVLGLGTQAVGQGEGIIARRDSTVAHLERLPIMDALPAPDFGEPVSTASFLKIDPDMLYFRPNLSWQFENLADLWRFKYEDNKPYYWEFAISPSYPSACILQSRLLSPSVIKNYELGQPEGQVVYETHEVFCHLGRKRGRGIALVIPGQELDSYDYHLIAKRIAEINRQHPGFLLLTPRAVFSDKKGEGLEVAAFDKASGVVELRPLQDAADDPSYIAKYLGGHTIAGSGKDILFQLVRMDNPYKVFMEKFGDPVRVKVDTYGQVPLNYSPYVEYWDREFIIENSQTGGRLQLI